MVGKDDKVAFVGGNELAKTTLFKIVTGELEPDSGSYKWGITTSVAYFPKRQYRRILSMTLRLPTGLLDILQSKMLLMYADSFGRMLFPGEDGVKKSKYYPVVKR